MAYLYPHTYINSHTRCIYIDEEEEDDAHDLSEQGVHVFNVTFWPLTQPSREVDNSIMEHDPMLNGFEVAQNYRQVLYCESCQNRLRSILCATCQKGYCFYCAFRSHAQTSRRSHNMQVYMYIYTSIRRINTCSHDITLQRTYR